MASIEQRLQQLAEMLGNKRPLCPICRNAPTNIIIYDDLDGGEPHVTGQRCPTCGSPDAHLIHVHYENETPVNPAAGLRDYPHER